MYANNVYDFEKKFHLRFGRNPRPDELWRAATDAAEENSNSSPSGPPTQAKTSVAPSPKREIAAEIERLLFGSPEVYKYVSVNRKDLKRWRQLLLA